MTTKSPLSQSNVEEIIAALWTIVWVLLWAHDAHRSLIWLAGFKAISDFLTACHAARKSQP